MGAFAPGLVSARHRFYDGAAVSSDPRVPKAPLSGSVLQAQEKVKEQRLARLVKGLESFVTDPLPLLDSLMAELVEGSGHPDLWEKLHAAACRDGIEKALKDAYERCIAGPRTKRMSPEAQAALFMHAADYFRGVIGDAAGADAFLERAIAAKPDHVEAYTRLERRFEAVRDKVRLLNLIASVAATPPKPPAMLAGQASQKLLELVGRDAAPDDTCRKLVGLVHASAKLLDALEKHCRSTKRPALAGELMDKAIETGCADDKTLWAWRERVVDIYTGEANLPAKAIGHVEVLLEKDPSNAKALAAAEKLLKVREVNSRAAAALAASRRARRGGGPSQPPPPPT